MLPDLPAPHLVADGLARRFGRRVLFEGLALEVGPGEAVAVTGPNGSGKSTLLLILAGLLAPSAGTVRLALGGRPVPTEERPLCVGLASPALQLYGDLSAEENLGFLAEARRLPEGRRRAAALLERMGLGGRGADAVKTFSSGMRQRLRIAAALLPAPALLFLDEPGANLDEAGRALVADVVRAQRAAGGAVVLATNVDDEAALCDRALRLGAAASPQPA